MMWGNRYLDSRMTISVDIMMILGDLLHIRKTCQRESWQSLTAYALLFSEQVGSRKSSLAFPCSVGARLMLQRKLARTGCASKVQVTEPSKGRIGRVDGIEWPCKRTFIGDRTGLKADPFHALNQRSIYSPVV